MLQILISQKIKQLHKILLKMSMQYKLQTNKLLGLVLTIDLKWTEIFLLYVTMLTEDTIFSVP